ncbi:MAG: bifunctional folylpolyglutamate synthase/dihydrofolate synthase [Flavobacteriales bacterium]
MIYQDTLDYLFSQLPMYQRSGAAAYKEDIGNIIKACDILQDPHKKFKSIHIAGTNGKGSTAHMLASILQEAGFKAGLYTSPHLKDFRERIKINGKMISKDQVIDFVKKNKTEFEKINMSFFEYTVAMAFDYFAESQVDIAIIETGLGGRLDSTNIISPELSVITNIGYDHTNLLGSKLEQIAKEKAGIIKKNTPVVIGRKQEKIINDIFKITAYNKKSKIFFSEINNNISCDLKGEYQKENINTTIKAIEVLNWNIDNKNIYKGLKNVIKNTGLNGRWQIISKTPHIICDTGHNQDGIKNITRQLKKINFNNLHFIFGTVKDKNITEIIKLLPKEAMYYFCAANIDRAFNASKLKDISLELNLQGNAYNSVKDAYNNAISNYKKDDLIFIGGSTFVVAEIL